MHDLAGADHSKAAIALINENLPFDAKTTYPKMSRKPDQ
jgi:hypothetical protein